MNTATFDDLASQIAVMRGALASLIADQRELRERLDALEDAGRLNELDLDDQDFFLRRSLLLRISESLPALVGAVARAYREGFLEVPHALWSDELWRSLFSLEWELRRLGFCPPQTSRSKPEDLK